LKRRATTVAQESGGNGWTEGYNYDQYGTVMSNAATTTVQAPLFMAASLAQIDATSNRIVKSTQNQVSNDVQYNNAGDMTVFPGMTPNMAYDAEDRLTSFEATTGAIATYTYDGQGRRATKTSLGVTTSYVYDTAGQLVAEYGGQSATAGTQYQTEDNLGSTRVVTDGAGKIVTRWDYMPFWGCHNGDGGAQPEHDHRVWAAGRDIDGIHGAGGGRGIGPRLL